MKRFPLSLVCGLLVASPLCVRPNLALAALSPPEKEHVMPRLFATGRGEKEQVMPRLFAVGRGEKEQVLA